MATNNAVNTSLSGQSGTGSFVGSESPSFTGTPVLSTASATSVTFTSTSGIIGTTTNNNAAAGSVGEIISSVIPQVSSVNYNTNTNTNITSISLTAGDWDVWGNVSFSNNAVGMSLADCWINTVSATQPDSSLRNLIFIGAAAGMSTCAMQAPAIRISISSTTTVYLSCRATFSAGTQSGHGGIYARRAR